MPSLRVRFRRISPTHHRLELVRDGGAVESVELETRSCLLHDLVHFATETEAGLRDAFFGRLAAGVRYADLAQPGAPLAGGDELAQTETVVGPLQAAWRAGLDAERFVAELRRYLEANSDPVPPWWTADCVRRIGERLRRLEGQWRATPFGAAMELEFAVGDP